MYGKKNFEKVKEAEGRRSSITSYYKRKTEDTSFEADPFGQSKKLERSPVKKKEDKDNDGMEELMKLMKEQMKEIKEMRNDYSTLKSEFTELKEKLISKEQRWEQQIQNLNTKVDTLERKLEYKERQDKRCNIIIKGLKTEANKERETIEKLFTEKLGFKVKPKEVWTIGKEKNAVRVILNSWEEKQHIMQKKRELRTNIDTEKVFIDNDLTEQEMKIRRIINETAKSHREEGREAKVGYKKLQINGKWWFWNENSGKLQETKN